MNTALWISIVGAIFCAIIAVFIEYKEKLLYLLFIN